MKAWSRRQVGTGAAFLASALVSPRTRAREKTLVVVVGGGIGGATIAKYLATSGAGISVILIEPKPQYTTCIFSNLYLAGARSLDSLTHGYEALAGYGIDLRRERVTAIDPEAKRVRLENGEKLSYDRLVISPGIAFVFDKIDGYDEAAAEMMPHAWEAGPQTRLLRAQLEAMDDGGVFVISVPSEPYRCPVAPYERAALAAYYFRQFKPRSKILIVDAKDTFFEQDLFQDGWQRHYRGMVEWMPAKTTGGVTGVDPKAGVVKTVSGHFKAAVANIIPPQAAGTLASSAGLTDQSGWCPVDPATFESTLQEGIYVVGDAARAGEMPKTAFCANSQAKACAFAIVADLIGSAHTTPHLFEAGFTFLAGDDAVSDFISFRSVDHTLKVAVRTVGTVRENSDIRRQTVRRANSWYDAFMHDVLG